MTALPRVASWRRRGRGDVDVAARSAHRVERRRRTGTVNDVSAEAAPVPQRLCPHCASVAVTAAPKCPWCGRRYRRGSILPAIVALALVQTAVILGVVIYALSGTGDAVQDQVDDGIVRIEREIDTQVHDIDTTVRRELRRELDRRLPAAP
jgi:hypothetical protein